MARYVKDHQGDNDVIVFAPLMQMTPFVLYYDKSEQSFGRFGNGVDMKGVKVEGRWSDRYYVDDHLLWGINKDCISSFVKEYELNISAQKNEKIYWVIVSGEWIGRNEYSLLMNFIRKHFIVIEKHSFSFEGLELFQCKTKENPIVKELIAQ